MATTVARLEAVLSADTRDFDSAMKKSERKTDSFGSKLAGLGKTAALAGGAAGIGALAVGLKIGIKEYTQGVKVAAQTNAVIKSTGGIANVTAAHVSKLGEALMKKSGIDDEVIKTGENMLLTFKNIRNEVGKGNDIFDQATSVLTDMTVALGSDPQKQAIQLGKALNDPIGGISALARVGVTFTEQQKKTIKALVDGGIPKELNSEFGGSAEAAGKTLPGQINIAKESFKNFTGELVTKAIPILKQVIGWLRDHWPEISAAIQTWWNAIKPVWVALGELVVSVVGLIRKHWGTIGPILNQVMAIIRNVFTQITNIIKLFTDLLRGDWSAVWQDLKNIVKTMLKGIMMEIRLELDVLLQLGKALGGKLLEGFKLALSAGWKALKEAISGLFGKVIDWAKHALGIKSPSSVFHEIGVNAIKGFVNGVGSMAGLLKTAVINIAKSLPAAVVGAVSGVLPGHNTKGASGIVRLGHYLQSLGFQVGENPAFGGVSAGRHAKNSYHYKGRAIDVNWPGGGPTELRQLQSIFGTVKQWHPVEEMIEDAGGSNQHLHIALDKGGWLPTGTTLVTNNTGRPERVLGPNEGGTTVYNFPNYVGSRQELMSWLRQANQQFSNHNGRPAFGA
jgi:hypothetical protein